jgi:hypothetical protein
VRAGVALELELESRRPALGVGQDGVDLEQRDG